MKKYIYIGVGGIFGAMLRYYIKNLHIYNQKELFPLNTLIINITGSFILALTLTTAYEIWEFDSSLRLGIATGFLGAFTTFSTMCKEIITLFNSGHYLLAVLYLIISAAIGLAAAYLGAVLARKVMPRIAGSRRIQRMSHSESASELEKEGD